MNRREFSKAVAGAIGAAGASAADVGAAAGSPTTAPYQISVMLWTVFRKLPVAERLEKVAEAGYSNVELVGEYKKWSEAEFREANAKRKELKLRFDVTAGLKHGAANPADQDALLADVKNELATMQEIECPALIIMSGNVVPGMPRDQQHQSCIEGLKRAAALVEGKQINGQPVRLLL